MSDVVVNLNSDLLGVDSSEFSLALEESLSALYGHPVTVKVSEVVTNPAITITLNDFNNISGAEAYELMAAARRVCLGTFREFVKPSKVIILMKNSTLVY